MKSYDLRCPICGTVNRGLYLEETDGWMECEKCGNVTQSMEHRQTVLIPLILKTRPYCGRHLISEKERIRSG